MRAPESPTSTTQQRQPARLEAFIAEVERVIAAEGDPHEIVAAVQTALAPLLRDPSFLAPAFRQPWPVLIRPHLVAVAPNHAFSVMSLIWPPGQITPIHDHICWCVVGVLEGVEREQRFSLRQDEVRNHWLVPLNDVHVEVGQTSALIPPEENIHQVRNAGATLAISIHVYGADISVHGSSINQRFDELPIQPHTTAGHSVAWRRNEQ
jgi:predicted metal-dependent enzyme (double-stranded beta helix superfamily)